MKYIFAVQLSSFLLMGYMLSFTEEYIPSVFTNDVAAFFADPVGIIFLVSLIVAPIVYILEKE